MIRYRTLKIHDDNDTLRDLGQIYAADRWSWLWDKDFTPPIMHASDVEEFWNEQTKEGTIA